MIWRQPIWRNIFQRSDGTQYLGCGIHHSREIAQHLAMLSKPDSVKLVYRVKIIQKYPKHKRSFSHF